MSFDNQVVEQLKGVQRKKAEITERFGDMGEVVDRYFKDANKIAALYIVGEMSDDEFERNCQSMYGAIVNYSISYGDESGRLIHEIFDIASSARKAAKTPEELARIKAALSVDQDQSEALCVPFE
jgi:hypothetical protein